MKVRKIAALAVGAAMVGATIGFANAQENFPGKDFFVKDDGTPNVKIVVGSQAAAMDVASAADIAVALGTLLYTKEEAEASAVAVFKELPATVGVMKVYDSEGVIEAGDLDGDGNVDEDDLLYTEAPNKWYNGSEYEASSRWYFTDPGADLTEYYDGTKDSWQALWDTEYYELDLGDKEKIIGPADDWESALAAASPNAGATVTIDDIDIVDPDGKAYPTGDERIKIPAEAFNYTVDYSQWGKKLVKAASCCEDAEYAYYIKDPGIQPGDSFTLLGQPYHVVCVYGNYTAGLDLASICPTCEALPGGDYVLLLASDAIEGQKGWVEVNGKLTLADGRYEIEVLDIGVVSKNVLLKVKDNELGREKLVTVSEDEAISVWGDGDDDGDDDIVVILEDTFIGLSGAAQARLLAYTDLRAVNDGDSWPSSDWTVHFYGMINDGNGWKDPSDYGFSFDGWSADDIIDLDPSTWAKAVRKIVLINSDDLPDEDGEKTIDIPTVDPVYQLVYDADICMGDCKDEDSDHYGKYVYKATVTIDVKKVGGLTTQEVEEGDEFEGYELESNKATVETVKIVPITEPITYLDTEIDVNAVDSNLILVGGPVANTVTKYLVDQGLSTIDWYNSEGDLEYIENAFGDYDVLIVAGKDRYATKEAAKKLLEYLATLVG